MKKIYSLIMILCLFTFLCDKTYAKSLDDSTFTSGNYVNNNSVSINELQLKNLREIGFTDQDIKYMDRNEFEYNKNVNAKQVSKDVIYVKTTYVYEKGNLYITSNTALSLLKTMISEGEFQLKNIINEEISESEFNAATEQNVIVPMASTSIVETTYKKLTTTISYISASNRYRFKNDLLWKIMPANRSYDDFGIRVSNNIEPLAGSEYAKLNYTYFEYCYNNNVNASTTYGVGNSRWKRFPEGYALAMTLPSNTSKTVSWSIFNGTSYPCTNPNIPPYIGNQDVGTYTYTNNVNAISSYMYFDVVKLNAATANTISAYGSYQHSVNSISLNTALTFTISPTGLGAVFSMSPSIASNFDNMQGTHAQITGINW